MKLSDLHRLAAQLSQLDQPDADQAREILLQLGFDPCNLYQELEMESRFADMHQDSSSTNGQIQLHSHTFYEILCCRNTCGAQYLMGAQRYRLQKGDILIVPPGVSHRPLLQNLSLSGAPIWKRSAIRLASRITPPFIAHLRKNTA